MIYDVILFSVFNNSIVRSDNSNDGKYFTNLVF